MRVLVAGATSVPGLPLLRELNARGHDVVGLTRQLAKTPQIEQAGAKPVVADVFDAAQIDSVVADIEPEVVVSLLTTLPKRGPMRVKDFEPARELWSRGAPNLVTAAQRAGVRRGRRRVGDLRLRLPHDWGSAHGRVRPVSGPTPSRWRRDAQGVA
jgi:nucleoside-diphosphate-sugar epimerase